MASTLLELLVKLSISGKKEVDKGLLETEKKAQAVDKSFANLPKTVEKATKSINKSLTDVGKSLDQIKEKQETWTKTIEDGQKRVEKSLGAISKTFDTLQGKVDKLNKSGLSFGAELKGGDEVIKSLDEISKRIDEFKDDTIKLTIELDGAKEVIADLDAIEAAKARVQENSSIKISIETSGAAEAVEQAQTIESALSSIDENRKISLDIEAKGGAETAAELKATDVAADRLDGRNVKMNIDAKGAEVLPALLGDINAQLSRFQFIAAAIAAATIPAFIAAAGAAASAVGVATAGVGALAVGLGEGLVGAAGATGAALGLAYASLGTLGAGAASALSNILGLEKGFGSFDGAIKAAEKEVKGFTELVGKMPAGTEAAAQAQDRLNESIEYQRQLTELQVEWWGKYGDAANDAAVQIDELRLGFIEIVNDLGGQLIPTITEFVEIANSHLPAVADAVDVMADSVDQATKRLTKFLETGKGFQDVENIITAIGEAAGPSLTILSNGLIVALQAMQPLIPAGLEILNVLADLSEQASAFARSAEGVAAINAAWQQMFVYAQQLGEAVTNLAVAGQQVSAAFLSSGLVDFMVQGFVDMTASIRSAAEGANQADSAFQQFLSDAMPILSAANEALGKFVSEALRAVGAITSMRDEATGALIMVEIFNGIRDAATPLAELLISTFTDLGPIIAELIPNIAQFLQLFLGSTPELTIFLGLVNDMLTAFNALPDSVQIVAARLLTYTLILKGLSSPVTSVVSGLSDMYLHFLLIKSLGGGTFLGTILTEITLLPTRIGLAVLSLQEMATAFYAAVAAGEVALGVLAAIAAIGTIAILVAIYFDTDAFKQAYDDAQAAGESTGGAFGEGVIAGLEAVPIVGDVVQWIDENLGQPLDNWITEHSGQFNAAWEAFWAQLGPTAQNSGVKEDIEQIWTDISDSSTENWTEIYTTITGFFTDIYGAVASTLAPMAPDIASIWADINGNTNSEWETIKGYVVDYATEAYNAVAEWIAPMAPDIAAVWADINGDTDSSWQTIKQYVIDACKAMYERVAADLAPMSPAIAKIWDEIDQDTGSTWTDSVKPAVVNACSAIAAAVAGTLGPAITKAIGFLRDLRTEATSLLNFLGSSATRGERDTPGTTTNPNAGAPTLKARGGVEVQGANGGVSDGLAPRVVYGEQSRRVKEAYIVEDRPDNFPYLVEAASWYGMGLVPMRKMASGGVMDPSESTATPGGSTLPDGSTGTVPFAPVASPTAPELAPYMADAAAQQGYMPVGIPAADWTGSDHINAPEGTVSGDPVGGQGGSVATPWPGLGVIASGGSATAWVPTKPTGPSFAMATGGTLPSGGSASGSVPVPLSYQAVPLGTWNQFLGLQWLADPTMDFPVLYPPSGYSPDQIYSPPMMARGGILRGGTRFFQGGGLNQAQIEAGLAAGSSALGSFYSYGSAGEDGGFDCAGIWNYIESAVAYGTPQTGKRWGTYDAAAGGGGSFTTPGTTPGGVNIGVDLAGWGGPDGTHMAGDIQDTAFESDTVSGVHNGNSSAAFGTQYTMGGAAEVAGMLPSDAGVAPPSTSPAPTMDSTVSDWWNTLAPPVPDATGATSGGPSASAGGQTVNIKMNANTGNKGGSGKSGDITQTQNITSPAAASSGTSPAAASSGSAPASTSGGGGTLADGVQNWMAGLPGVTEDYLQNVGQQTLGTAGQLNMPPLGNTTDDWIIAALEGMGMDPTPEAIATISSLMMQESGGDPAAVSPDGATGVMQMMPETWDAYNVGGDINDPVANIMASINYQLQRYGGLVDFSPYAKGGFALEPHLGMVGEAGREAMVPLDNRRVMSHFRANLGMDGLGDAMAVLADRVDNVAARVDYQTRVLPAETGRSVKHGYDGAITSSPQTGRALSQRRNFDAKRRIFAGV